MAPATTTTTTAAPQWYIIEDDNFWTSTEATYYSDSGGYWKNSDGTFELTDIGTWTREYRPSKIKVTIVMYGATTSGSIYLYDSDNNVLGGGTTGTVSNGVAKTLEWTLTFQGTAVSEDIDRLGLSLTADELKITNISFYGQYVPGVQVTTTTTTTIAATTTTTTTVAPDWQLIENDGYWTSSNSTWTWTGEYWQATGVDPLLVDIGTWTQSYRPTKLRLTVDAHSDMDPMFSGDVTLKSANDDPLVDAEPIDGDTDTDVTATYNITFVGSTTGDDINSLEIAHSADSIKIKTIEFYGQPVDTAVWYSGENNTFWGSTNATWSTDEGGKWTGDAGVNPELTDIGTWTGGYRPDRIRVIMRNTTTTNGYVRLYDASNNVIASSDTKYMPSAQLITFIMDITYQGTGAAFDINKLQGVTEATSTVIITSIDFDKPLPPASTTTTTTTTTTAPPSGPSWHGETDDTYWSSQNMAYWTGLEWDINGEIEFELNYTAGSIQPSKIEISGFSPGDYIIITVEDSGGFEVLNYDGPFSGLEEYTLSGWGSDPLYVLKVGSLDTMDEIRLYY